MSVRDWFGTSPTNVVASVLQFPAIDTDAMTRRLRLKERAREQASQGLPASGSDALDAIEQQIVNEIENEGKTQFNTYLDHQRTYAERVSDTGTIAFALELSAASSDARSDFERRTRVGTGELHALKREVIESERELERFRERHGLTRPARNIGPPTLKYGVLVLLLAIESVLNGFFLSKGNVFGLVGGTFEALIIAAINVFVGVAVGRIVLPWIAYRNWWVRIVAVLGALLYLIAATYFNLGVAHYRNAVSADPFEAAAIGFRSLIEAPLAINDLQSWLLVLIGLFFSLIAAFDGLLMNDPYPGYGQRARQNRDAIDDYTADKDQLYDDLEEVKKAADKKMEALAQGIQQRHAEFAYVAMKSQALKTELQQHFEHLESAGNTLLSYYRDENRKGRTTPAPVRFEDPWQYEPPSLGPDVIRIPDPQGVEDALKKILADAITEREAVNEAYRAALAEYRRIDDLLA